MFSKDKGFIYDRLGRKWVKASFDDAGPNYKVPSTAVYDMMNDTIDQLVREVGAIEINICAIPLPFYTLPMWVTKQDAIRSACDFSFYACLSCGEFINTACRVALVLILSQTESGSLFFSCRVQILCATCSPNALDACSHFPYVISAESYLHDPLTQGWKQYLGSRNHHCCYVCNRRMTLKTAVGVDDVLVCCQECARALEIMSRWQQKTPREATGQDTASLMTDIIQNFYENRVDVVSPLVKNHCYGIDCVNKIQKDQTPIKCYRNCRRIVYCSRRCRFSDKDHQCENFRTVWNPDNVIPLVTWTDTSADTSESDE